MFSGKKVTNTTNNPSSKAVRGNNEDLCLICVYLKEVLMYTVINGSKTDAWPNGGKYTGNNIGPITNP